MYLKPIKYPEKLQILYEKVDPKTNLQIGAPIPYDRFHSFGWCKSNLIANRDWQVIAERLEAGETVLIARGYFSFD